MLNPYLTYGEPEYCMSLFPPGYKGICVDVGAYDPFWISNSWIFEQAGWDTYCIEPNPNCIPKLKQYRKNVLQYACGSENKDDADFFIFRVQYAGPQYDNPPENWYGEAAGSGLINHCKDDISGEFHSTILKEIVKVKVRTLDWIMENEIKQDHIDYLSIDVERNEMEVLRGINLDRWKPKVIIIESLYNLDNYGVVDAGVEDPIQSSWLGKFGYKFIHRIPVNDIYIRV